MHIHQRFRIYIIIFPNEAMLYTPSFWYFQYVNRTTTAVTVAATVVTVEKTMCVTLRMDIVPMDVNNIGLD